MLGGTVTGARLSGEILPGRGPAGRSRRFATIAATQFIRTHDGAMIALTITASAPPRPSQGSPARWRGCAFSAYYMRFSCSLRTRDPRYGWLNTRLFFAAGARRPDCVELSVFELS